MNRFEKNVVAWSKGAINKRANHGEYTLTRDCIFLNGRGIAVRFRSPLGGGSAQIVIRDSWPDGGLLDSQINPAVHFKGSNWKEVDSAIYSNISSAVNDFREAKKHKRPDKRRLYQIGNSVRLLAKWAGDDHPILQSDTQAVGMYALCHKLDFAALCVWDEKIKKMGGFAQNTVIRACKTMDEAVLLKIKNGGALYTF